MNELIKKARFPFKGPSAKNTHPIIYERRFKINVYSRQINQ